MRFRFDDFTLDTERRELRRSSAAIPVPPKELRLLEILLIEHPRAVSQQALYDSLWPDTFVEKSNLYNLVYRLRAILDDRQGTLIKTVYGYGFSLGAAVASDERKAAGWQLVIGKKECDVHEGENIVGRERDAAIRLDAAPISRHHACITVAHDGVRIEDLGSKNGTSLHGKPVRDVQILRDGDVILFGTIAATLRALGAAPTTETER